MSATLDAPGSVCRRTGLSGDKQKGKKKPANALQFVNMLVPAQVTDLSHFPILFLCTKRLNVYLSSTSLLLNSCSLMLSPFMLSKPLCLVLRIHLHNFLLFPILECTPRISFLTFPLLNVLYPCSCFTSSHLLRLCIPLSAEDLSLSLFMESGCQVQQIRVLILPR